MESVTAGAASVIDLGCGGNKTPGAVGVDVLPSPGIDVMWDLNRRPWPFPDDAFDRAICRHALEHFDDAVAVMAEIHRICRPAAEVVIQVPHFSNAYAYGDPTHKTFFSSRSFDHFIIEHPYSFTRQARFELVSVRLSFAGLGHYTIEPWANRRLNWYERHCAFVFQGQDLTFVLRVVKGEANSE